MKQQGTQPPGTQNTKLSLKTAVPVFIFLILCICGLGGVLLHQQISPRYALDSFRQEMESLNIPGLKLKEITADTAEFTSDNADNIIVYNRRKNFVRGSGITLTFQNFHQICNALKDKGFSGTFSKVFLEPDAHTRWEGAVDFTFADGVLTGAVSCDDCECNPGKFRYDPAAGTMTVTDIQHVGGDAGFCTITQGEFTVPENAPWKPIRYSMKFKLGDDEGIPGGYLLKNAFAELNFDEAKQKITGRLTGKLYGCSVAGTNEIDLRTGAQTILLKGNAPENIRCINKFGEQFSKPVLSIRDDEKNTIRELTGTDYRAVLDKYDILAATMREASTNTRPETEWTFTNFKLKKGNELRLTAAELVCVYTRESGQQRKTAEEAPQKRKLKRMKGAGITVSQTDQMRWQLELNGGTVEGENAKFDSFRWGEIISGSAEGKIRQDGWSFTGAVKTKMGDGTFSGKYDEQQNGFTAKLHLPKFDWKDAGHLLPAGWKMSGAGSMTLTGKELILSGENCTAVKGGAIISGISFTGMKWTRTPDSKWITAPGQEITFRELKLGGFTFTNGKLRFRQGTNHFVLESAEAEWCGGKIRISPGAISEGTLFAVDCENLNPAQFLTQTGAGNFTGTGSLCGKLPFRLTKEKGLVPEKGLLFSRPGEDGTLKGTLLTGKQGTEGLDFAVAMMKDMVFRWVRIKLDSAADGQTLRLGLQFNASPGQAMMYEPDLVNGGIKKSAKPTRLGYLLLSLDDLPLKPAFLQEISKLFLQ